MMSLILIFLLRLIDQTAISLTVVDLVPDKAKSLLMECRKTMDFNPEI